MDTEKNLLIKTFRQRRVHLENIFNYPTHEHSAKSAKESQQFCYKGSELYSKTNHDAETHIEIFRYFCRSILLAPLDSEELGKAYEKRSEFLLHINKYEECITDVDRALKFNHSKLHTIELLCRKVECMKKLALPNYESVLKTAVDHADNVSENDRDNVDQIIRRIKNCSIDDSKVSKSQSNTIYTLPEVDQPLDCISIEYNENYGRHLIAKKDYKPGDFILRDNLYVTVLNPEMKYTNCNYCLKVCWAGIACDYCNWAMFCSEECKQNACQSFHDVECSIIPFEAALMHYFDPIRISLRMLLVGIRESGSIDKLRENLKLVDEATDNRYKGFYKNDRFTISTIESIYSLQSRECSTIDPHALAFDVLVTLNTILKRGNLIEHLQFDNIDDIIRNENAVFLGSLLIKLTLISMNNGFLFAQAVCDCQRLKKLNYECCGRGIGIATLASLLNHSCNPNAARVFTEDRRINIFALKPIKKNSQIFITYTSFYFNKDIKERKEILKQYNFTCTCKACTESWPQMRLSSYSELVAKQSGTEKKLYNDCKYICGALIQKELDFIQKDVKKLSKTIVKAHKRLTEPTFLMALLDDSLIQIHSRLYGWKAPIHVFGKC